MRKAMQCLQCWVRVSSHLVMFRTIHATTKEKMVSFYGWIASNGAQVSLLKNLFFSYGLSGCPYFLAAVTSSAPTSFRWKHNPFEAALQGHRVVLFSLLWGSPVPFSMRAKLTSVPFRYHQDPGSGSATLSWPCAEGSGRLPAVRITGE